MGQPFPLFSPIPVLTEGFAGLVLFEKVWWTRPPGCPRLSTRIRTDTEMGTCDTPLTFGFLEGRGRVSQVSGRDRRPFHFVERGGEKVAGWMGGWVPIGCPSPVATFARGKRNRLVKERKKGNGDM